MNQSRSATAKTRPSLTFADIRIANTVLKFSKRDFDRPEVQADFKRWKEERAIKEAKEGGK